MGHATVKFAIVSMILLWTVAPVAAAQDADFEPRILGELQSQSPEAVPAFVAANDARAAGNLDVAAIGYERVRELAPHFVHATRRLCQVELARGHADAAERSCREAVAAEESPENLASLASVLMAAHDPAKLEQAGALVTQAEQLAPDSWNVLLTRAQLEIVRGDLSAVRAAAARADAQAPAAVRGSLAASLALALAVPEERDDPGDSELLLARELADRAVELGPRDAYAHMASGTVALVAGDAELARREALRVAELEPGTARTRSFVRMIGTRLGMPDPAGYDYDREPATTSDHWSWLGTIAKVLAGWLLGLVLLLAFGALLSSATLRAARSLPSSHDGGATGTSRVLRSAYRVVIGLSIVYYYVSVPVVLLAVIAAAGALLYAIFAVGVIPVKLVLIVVVVVGVTVWAVLKALFVRGRDDDPGTKLDLAQEPKLRAVLDEVARRVGTRAVDSVYITPGTDIAVLERGGLLAQVRGRSERCLVLGVAVLDGMTLVELKAVLAHEYGHFRNEDTAGGGFALAVRRSLMTMALALFQGGAAGWHNPAWWFVNGFHRVFLRVSQGASRLQEILADRWAAFAYGPKAFERGLRHVIERSVRFDAHVGSTIREVVDQKLPLANLYAFVPSSVPTDVDVANQVSTALAREPSPYDSHPAPRDRIEWIRELQAVSGPRVDDEDQAWSVFRSRADLERQMTGEVKLALRMQTGIHIPAG